MINPVSSGALVPVQGRLGSMARSLAITPFANGGGPSSPPVGSVSANPSNPSGGVDQSSYGPVIGDSSAPYALISTGARYIDTIIPDVAIEEAHNDQLRITDHPVETGAPISDHAFHIPSEVMMRIGFSDSTHQAAGFVKQVYAKFVALQARREPFNVSTGKRLYQNMLIQSMQVTTDATSEYALMMVVNLREIIITYTQQATSSQNQSPNPGDQGSPSQSTPTDDGGDKGTPTFISHNGGGTVYDPPASAPSSSLIGQGVGGAGTDPVNFEPGAAGTVPPAAIEPTPPPGYVPGFAAEAPWDGVSSSAPVPQSYPPLGPEQPSGIPLGAGGTAENPAFTTGGEF
jgi:hypothetical protein